MRRSTLLAGLLLPAVLTACGSGLDPQTYRERTTQDATNAQIGDLALRNVSILPPSNGAAELAVGGDALATLTIVSRGRDADTLTSVTSTGATSVELVDGTGHPVPSVQVPAGGSAGPAEFSLALRGLTKALRPGMYIPMTFTFDKNGRRDFLVPVRVWDSPVPRASFSPKSAASE